MFQSDSLSGMRLEFIIASMLSEVLNVAIQVVCQLVYWFFIECDEASAK